MDEKTAYEFILQNEGIQVEFKAGIAGFPQSIYESVASFLNRHGGHLFIGIKDDGEIIGLKKEQI